MGEKKWAEYQRKRKIIKVIEWRKRAKKRLIDYKGGKCEICGYDKDCSTAYDFHHKNTEEKEFSISSDGKTRSIERLKKEVDKCMLLCANCHREIHHKEQNEIYEKNVRKRKLEIKDLLT